MKTDNKRILRRLELSSIDMEQAVECSKQLLENWPWDETNEKERTMSRALQTTMIVAYVRPFSGNYNKTHTLGKLELDLKDKFSKKEISLHARIIDMRHTVFAHTDSQVRDLKVSVLSFGGAPTACPISHNPYVLMEKSEIQDFHNLATKMQALICSEIISLQSELSIDESF